MRYQQVYAASQLSAICDGGGYIWLLAFRLDGNCTGTGSTISNLQIDLSTTSRGPDSLSAVFAENVGPDNTVVFGPSRFSTFLTCPPAFEALAVLRNSFFYDPKAGNLLLDIRNFSGASDDGTALLRLDGHDAVGDSISSLLAFNVTAQSASEISSFGFVTKFYIQPTPRLHLSLTLTNLVFRWVNHPGNWTLQKNSTFGANSIWQPAGGIVTTNGGNREITMPLDPGTHARFFRLILLPSSPGSAGVQTFVSPKGNSKQEY